MPLSSTLPADGKSTQTLTLDLKDEQGNPLDMPATDVIIDTGTQKAARAGAAPGGAKVGALEKTAPGVYTVTVTAGTLQETLVLTPVVGGVRMTPSRVVINAVPPSGTNSTVSTDKTSITANGQDSMTVTFVAKDANNNPIPGIASDITFKVVDKNGNPAPAGAVTVSPATEIAPPGTYTATVTGTGAGNYTLIPEYNNTPVDNGLKVPVELKAGDTPDGTQSTLAVPSPQSITADGESASTLSVTAKDAQGNLIKDLSGVTFAVTDGNGNPVTEGVTVSTTTNAGDGTYTAQLKGTKAGTYTVTPMSNGTAIGSLSNTVTLTAGTTPDGTISTFSASQAGIIADDHDATTLTFHAKDAQGNAITGLTGLTFVATPATGATVSAVTEMGDGVYRATMTSTQEGGYTVVPQLSGAPVAGLSATINVAGVATAVSGILVNGYTFSPTSGFPHTGFTGAKFTVQLNGGEPTDYNWTSSASWAPVGPNGVVEFTGEGDNAEITITATHKSSPTIAISYVFRAQYWVVFNNTPRLYSGAVGYCSGLGNGFTMMTSAQAGGSYDSTAPTPSLTRGQVGSVWSEWGNMTAYPNTPSAPLGNDGTWTSTTYNHEGEARKRQVRCNTGVMGYANPETIEKETECRRAL
ncbi:Invasin [Serratia marcescens]|nr:Invasin [Serratia marcescens]